MTVNAFVIAELIAVVGVSVLAWCKRKNVGGKIWAVRSVPPCLLVAGALKLPFGSCLLFAFVVYAVAAYFGGWRLQSPRNAILRWIWWMVHVFVYLLMVTVGYAIVCTVLSIAVVSMPSTKIGPITVNTESHRAAGGEPFDTWNQWGGREYRASVANGIVHVHVREDGKVSDINTNASGFHKWSVSPLSDDKLSIKSSDIGHYVIEKHEGRWRIRSETDDDAKP